jgi:hypothetical protein
MLLPGQEANLDKPLSMGVYSIIELSSNYL